ncbi:hypothetical protein DL96DRAFT_240167 [Flagelloscypha sp. PMI_526]|nr:hypothetical protein DL96DRAFT_240167 [Flagelloscypha sp. PMI_526]
MTPSLFVRHTRRSTSEVTYDLDNTSPLIHYSPKGAWGGDKSTDPLYSSYSNSTFSATENSNATATIYFNGTEISLYGAKRLNHGTYTVTLDGQTFTFDGHGDPDAFQQLLFSAKDLSSTIPHTLVLMNTPTTDTKNFVDIDWVTITSSGVANQENVPAYKFDCGKAGPTSWSDMSTGVVQYRQTTTKGASCNIGFTGPSISLYGEMGPSGTLFTVALDHIQDNQIYNTSALSTLQNTLLYQVTGLGGDEEEAHVLTITHAGSANGNETLALGYASVNGVPKKTLSSGAIAGIVVGLIILCSLLFLLGFVLWRRRRQQESSTTSTTEHRSRSLGHPAGSNNFGIEFNKPESIDSTPTYAPGSDSSHLGPLTFADPTTFSAHGHTADSRPFSLATISDDHHVSYHQLGGDYGMGSAPSHNFPPGNGESGSVYNSFSRRPQIQGGHGFGNLELIEEMREGSTRPGSGVTTVTLLPPDYNQATQDSRNASWDAVSTALLPLSNNSVDAHSSAATTSNDYSVDTKLDPTTNHHSSSTASATPVISSPIQTPTPSVYSLPSTSTGERPRNLPPPPLPSTPKVKS